MRNEYFNICRACFDFYQAHRPPEKVTREWLMQFAEASVNAVIVQRGNPFAMDMLFAVINQIEREAKIWPTSKT